MPKPLRWGILLFCVAVLGVILFGHSPRRHRVQAGRLKLPVGQVTPAIRLGAAHGLILASDGSLWSWGENWAGWHPLGLSNTNPQTCLHRIGNGKEWISIASSFTHNLAVKSDGTLWAWGENLDAQLGDGTKMAEQPTPVPSVAGNDWKQAAAGGAHSVALKRDGTLWSWGNNWAGQLGIGSTKDSATAVRVGSNTNWTRVWAGSVQTIGLQADGSLWIWGSLTGDTDANRYLVPTRLSPDTNWVDVCCGYFMAFAIKADGTLWAWGRQAGIYTGKPVQILDATPAQVGTDNDWQGCASSEWFYHLLKKKDGSLWALDASEHGIVKPAAAYRPIQLTRIGVQKDFVAFAAAGRGVMGVALTGDGEVWTWGKAFAEYTPANAPLQALSRLISRSRFKVTWGEPRPKTWDEPWQLRNIDPAGPAPK